MVVFYIESSKKSRMRKTVKVRGEDKILAQYPDRRVNAWIRDFIAEHMPHITDKELAERLDLTPSAVGHWFNLRRSIPLDRFLSVCKIINQDPAHIIETCFKTGKEENLALVQNINLIRLFEDRELALELNQKLLQAEKKGLLGVVNRVLEGLLSDENPRKSKERGWL